MKTVEYPSENSKKPNYRNLQSIILTLYGGETWKEIRSLEKTRVKIQRKESDLHPYLSLLYLSFVKTSPDDESWSRLETSTKKK